jgi:hypothetical protein
VLEPESAAFRIGLLGPSRIGKTSLITALLAESQQLLAGSQVVQSRFHSERRSGCCGERDDLRWRSRWVVAISGIPELHG